MEYVKRIRIFVTRYAPIHYHSTNHVSGVRAILFYYYIFIYQLKRLIEQFKFYLHKFVSSYRDSQLKVDENIFLNFTILMFKRPFHSH